jgi:DNA-3-methyladenine glycosylase II
LPLSERDIVVTIYFNGDPEQPEFHIESHDDLKKSEIAEANRVLSRILGTELIYGLFMSAQPMTLSYLQN